MYTYHSLRSYDDHITGVADMEFQECEPELSGGKLILNLLEIDQIILSCFCMIKMNIFACLFVCLFVCSSIVSTV